MSLNILSSGLQILNISGAMLNCLIVADISMIISIE